MLHADRPKRVKRTREAQQQPKEMEGDEENAAEIVPAVASADDSGLDLPDCITNQEEMDEAVNEWLFDVELEGLKSGLPRDVCNEEIVSKARLSSNFGAPSRGFVRKQC